MNPRFESEDPEKYLPRDYSACVEKLDENDAFTVIVVFLICPPAI
jgi:hypothetical protein